MKVSFLQWNGYLYMMFFIFSGGGTHFLKLLQKALWFFSSYKSIIFDQNVSVVALKHFKKKIKKFSLENTLK